jgi:carboxypeptidase C (cathepsin A)
MGLDSELKKNITMKYYEAGHMLYAHKPSIQQMKKDIDGFIDQTSGQ